LPRATSQADSIAMVERIRDLDVPVYDIQVEGNHNFFGNGRLLPSGWLLRRSSTVGR
jgi:hypothetical protein